MAVLDTLLIRLFENHYNVTPSEGELIHRYRYAQHLFVAVVGTVFLIVGTLGNVCVIVTLNRNAFRRNPMSEFFKVLATFDLVVLWIGLTRHMVESATLIDVRRLNETLCFTHTWVTYAISTALNWFLTALTLTRVIFLKYPYQAKRYITRSLVYQIAFLLLMISFVVYGATFILYIVDVPQEEGIEKLKFCGIIMRGTGDVRALVVIYFYFVVPACCIVFLNAYTYVVLRSIGKQRRRLQLLARESLHTATQALRRATVYAVGGIAHSFSQPKDYPPAQGSINTELQSEPVPFADSSHTDNQEPARTMPATTQTQTVALSLHQRDTTTNNEYSGASAQMDKASARQADRELAPLLAICCVMFVLLNLPWAVHMFTFQVSALHDPVEAAAKELVATIVSVLCFGNNAFNFLLYTAFGSLFRSELKDAIYSMCTECMGTG